MEEPIPGRLINIDGPPSESVFHHPLEDVLNEESQRELQAQIEETVGHVAALNEDRLLVLVGALLVENAVDGLLSAVMPGYESLRRNRDVTLSVRIELARALQLCPSRLFTCADVVRQVRNDFVHDLSVDTFAKLPQYRVQSIRDRLSEFNPQEVLGKGNAEVFKKLVYFLVLALRVYRLHVLRLNEFIRSDKLFPVL